MLDNKHDHATSQLEIQDLSDGPCAMHVLDLYFLQLELLHLLHLPLCSHIGLLWNMPSSLRAFVHAVPSLCNSSNL